MSAGLVRLHDLAFHKCYGFHEAVTASEDTFCNGLGIVRKGDRFDIHCCSDDCHDGTANGNGTTTIINGRPAQKVGDPVTCGSTICSSSGNVFIK